MKKALVVILIASLLCCMSLTATAADFAPSVEAKTAPEIVEIVIEDKSYGTIIINQTDEFVEGVPIYKKDSGNTILELYMISLAEKEQAILPEITDRLTEAEKEIKSASDLGKLDEGLDKELKEEIDKFYGDSKDKIAVEDIVVCDLFDASLVRDKLKLEWINDGENVRFMIKTNFSQNDFFVLLHSMNEKEWEIVKDIEWTEDGSLLVTVDQLGVFAFAVARPADLPVDPHGPDSPQTGMTTREAQFLYMGIAIVCVGVAVIFFVKAKREEIN